MAVSELFSITSLINLKARSRKSSLSKKVLFTWIIILILTCGPVFSQSRMPSGANNWLGLGYRGVAGQDWHGDMDHVQVIFFEVPDTETSTLYFGINDAGVDSQLSGGVADWINETTPNPTPPPVYHASDQHFYLVGGSGCMSNSLSKKVYYATRSEARTGTVLANFTILQANAGLDLYNIQGAETENWTYFSGVSPSQGEHIGNKYYFKAVIEIATPADTACDFKNGFQLDISYNSSGTPTGVSGVRSFAYSLTVGLVSGVTWNFYPFVPDTANTAHYVMFHNWDADVYSNPVTPPPDFDGIYTGYAKTGAKVLTPINISGNNNPGGSQTGATSAFQISAVNAMAPAAEERNGTWRLQVQNGREYYQSTGCGNLAEYWFTIDDDSDPLDSPTDSDIRSVDTDAYILPVYSQPYNPPAADHVIAAPADGKGIANGVDTEYLALQIVDGSGNPVPYVRSIFVSVNGAAVIDSASSGGGGANTLLVTTDSSGGAWIKIRDGTAQTVTVTLETNGAGGASAADSALPGNAFNSSPSLLFETDPVPVISSASNLNFTQGNAVTLPDIMITDSGTANITTTNNIRIHIPAGLNAVFDSTVNTTSVVLSGGAAGQLWSIQNPPSGGNTTNFTGMLTYEDADKTAVIYVSQDFDAARVVTISGLKFTAANTHSSGSLHASATGPGTFPIQDDKIITINDIVSTYTWNGSVSTDWATAANWTPNGDPSGLNVIIPVVGTSQYPTLAAIVPASVSVKSLAIASGASLTLMAKNLTVTEAIDCDGTLDASGNGTVTVGGNVDFTNGTYTKGGAGDLFTFNGGSQIFKPYNRDFGNVSLTNTANVTMSGAATMDNLTIAAGTSLQLDGGSGACTLNISNGSTLANGNVFRILNSTNAVTLKAASGTFNFIGNDITYTVNQDLSLGGVNYQPVTLSIPNGTTITLITNVQFAGIAVQNGGSLITGGFSLALTGNWSVTAGGSFDATGSTVTFSGGNLQTLASGGTTANYDFNQLTINKTGNSVRLLAASMVTGNLTVSSGALDTNGQNITVNGNVDFTGGSYTKGGTFTFNGGAGQSFKPNALDFGAVSTATAATIVTMTGTGTVDSLTIANATTFRLDGTLSGCTLNVNNSGTITNNGTFQVYNSTNTVTLQAAGGGTPTFTYTGGSNAIDFNAGQDLTIGGLIYTPAFTVPANTVLTLNTDASFGTSLDVNGAAAQISQLSHKLTSLGPVTITQGTIIIGSGGTLDLATKDLTIGASGVLNTSGTVNCRVLNSSGTITNTAANTINATGNVTLSNTFNTPANNTLNMSGAATLINTMVTIGNFTVDVTPGNGTVSISTNPLTVSGNLIIAAADVLATGGNNLTVNGSIACIGSLTAALGGNVDVKGNADFSSGTFTKGAGAFIFSGAGAQSFNPNAQVFANVNTSNTADVTMQGTATFDDLNIAPGTFFRLSGIASPCTLNIASGKSITNNGTFQVANATNTVTIKAASGSFIYNTGTGISLAANLSLGGVTYQAPLSVPGSTVLTLVGACTFTNTVSVAGTVLINNQNPAFNGNVACTGSIANTGTGSITFGGATIDFTGGTFTKNATGNITFNRGGAQAFSPAGQSFGNVVVSTAATNVTMTGTATFDNLTINATAGTTFVLNGTTAACTLDITNGGSITNNQSFSIVNSTFPVTIEGAGGTCSFGGNGITFNSQVVHLARIIPYGPAATLGPNEGLIIDANCTFSNPLTLNGAGATLATAAGTTLTMTNDQVLVTNGTLTLNNGSTLTTGGGAFNVGTSGSVSLLANATVNTSGGGIDISGNGNISLGANAALATANGNFSISNTGGSLTLAATSSLNTGTGSVTNAGTINSSGTVQCGALTSSGTFTNAAANTITAAGNVIISGTFSTPVNNSLTMSGAGTTINANAAIGNFTVDIIPGNGTVSISTNPLTVSGNLTIAANDTLAAVASNLSINGSIDCNGTLNAGTANIYARGNVDFNTAGAVFIKGSGTFYFMGGTAKSFTINGQDFGNVELESTGANVVTLLNNATMDNLTINTLATFIIDYTGQNITLTINNTKTITNYGIFQLAGAGNTVYLTAAAGGSFVFANQNGISFNGRVLHMALANRYYPAVNLSAGEGLIIEENCTFDSTVTLNGAGTAVNIPSGKTLTTTNDAVTITNGTIALGTGSALNMGTGAFVNSSVLTTSGTITCGNFTSTGTFTNTATNIINASGDVVISGSFTNPANNTLTMTGTAKTINSTQSIGYLNINNGGGKSITGNNLTVNMALIIANGDTLSTGTYTLSVLGVLDANGLLNASGNGNVNVHSDVDFTSGSYSRGTGTFTFGGGAAQNLTSNAQNLGNIQFSGAGTAVTLLDNLSYQNLTIAASTSLSVNGHILNNPGVSFNNLGTLYRRGTVGESAPIDADSGTVIYINAGGSIQSYGATPGYYDLEIAGTGTFTLDAAIEVTHNLVLTTGTFTLNAALNVDGNIDLNAPASFNANNRIITLKGNFDNSGNGTFNSGTSELVLIDNTKISQILGNNTFYKFTCLLAGKTIEFENSGAGGYTTIAAGGTITITGTSGNEIIMKSTVAPPGSPTFPPVMNEQWILDIPLTANYNIDYANIQLGYAIIILTPDDSIIDTWCYNWITGVSVGGSWTLDTDNNGKIDTIRVQVKNSVQLNDNFTSFTVYVTGYAVTSYSTDVVQDDIFYIQLAEGPMLDTDAKPVWWITANTSLKPLLSPKFVVATAPPVGETPADSAPPVIGYTLAVADKNEIFISFSEPVYRAVNTAILAGDFSYGGAVSVQSLLPVTTSGNGTKECLLRMTGNITASEARSQTLITSAPFIDGAVTPNTIASTTHRVTDVGLGLAGTGLLEPILAYNDTVPNPAPGGIGVMTNFDGTGWLRDQNITLTTFTHSGLGISPTVKLHYDVNVPAANILHGLWLPLFDTTRYNGLAGYPNTQSRSVDGTAGTNASLRDYAIPASDSEVADGSMVQFILEITDTPLYCARVINANAVDWYRYVVPWSFDIHDIKDQGANVTILKNVINPTLGEQTSLRYILSQAGTVTIQVFDLKGDLVTTLSKGNKAAGDYMAAWDGRNKGGRTVARGVYFIKIVAPKIEEIRKVLVVK